jgi:autotransporter-associated beta strand protein
VRSPVPLLLVIAAACPAADVWTGASDGVWSNGANWLSGSAPANNDTADIQLDGSTNTTITLDADWSVNSLTFTATAGAFTVNGPGALTVRGGGIANLDTDSIQTIACTLRPETIHTWTGTAQASPLVVAGNLAGNAWITLAGNNGRFVLAGTDNSGHSGPFTWTSGNSCELFLRSPGAMIGSHIDLSAGGSGHKLVFDFPGAGQTLTPLLGGNSGGARIHYGNTGGAGGIVATQSDTVWRPATTAGVSTWASALSLAGAPASAAGYGGTAASRIILGGVGDALQLSANRTLVFGGNSNFGYQQIRLLSGLDTNGFTLTLGGGGDNYGIWKQGGLVLTAPHATTSSGGGLSVGNANVISRPYLAFSDPAQLPPGNLGIGNGSTQGGTLLFDNVTWAAFIANRSGGYGTGDGMWQLRTQTNDNRCSGFAARTAPLRIADVGVDATMFDRSLALGSGAVDPDDTAALYANAAVTVACDTTLTGTRTWYPYHSGTGLNGIATSSQFAHRMAGRLSGTGSFAIKGMYLGVADTNPTAELVLGPDQPAPTFANTWSGAPVLGTLDCGPGGLAIGTTGVGEHAFGRFDDTQIAAGGGTSLPTGGGPIRYIACASEYTKDYHSGMLFTGSVAGTAYRLDAGTRLVLGSRASGDHAPVNLGAYQGSSTLEDAQVYLSIGDDAAATHAILVRNPISGASTFTLGSAGHPVTFIPVTWAGSAGGSPTAPVAPVTASRTLVKRGFGTAVLGNVRYRTLDAANNTASTTDALASVTWQIGRSQNSNSLLGGSSYDDGAIRALADTVVGADATNSFVGQSIFLRGGVVEFDTGGAASITWNRTVGTGLFWGTNGGGGFAAYGGTVVIDLNTAGTRDTLIWNGGNFLQTTNNASLILSSRTATGKVEWYDHINLCSTATTQTREIRVLDNESSAADYAEISGNLLRTSGTVSFMKAGKGTLRLSGTGGNYNGTTRVAAGTLLLGGDVPVSGNSVVGNAASQLYVGSSYANGNDTALLIDGAFTVARDVQSDNDTSGTCTFGGQGAQACSFTGGVILRRTTQVQAETGGTVTLAGVVSELDAAQTLVKVGTGRVVMQGANTYTGATTISAGTMQIDGSTQAASAVSVASGATLCGGGTIGGAVTVAAGGQVSGGAAGAVGTLTAASLAGAGTIALDLAPGGSDRIDLSGAGTVCDRSTLALALSGTPAGTITIMQCTGGGSMSGAFAQVTGLPAGYALERTASTVVLRPAVIAITWNDGSTAAKAWAIPPLVVGASAERSDLGVTVDASTDAPLTLTATCSASAAWTPGATAGTDVFRMATGATVLTTVGQSLGSGLATGATVALPLRFTAPLAGTLGVQQTVTVTVAASATP